MSLLSPMLSDADRRQQVAALLAIAIRRHQLRKKPSKYSEHSLDFSVFSRVHGQEKTFTPTGDRHG